jgi:hypothetical protein
MTQASIGETFHSYSVAVSKRVFDRYAYLEYGTLEHPELLERYIHTIGFELPGGFHGDDGKVYHHIFVVLSRDDITDELTTLFPKVTGNWTHKIEKATGEEDTGAVK